MKHLDRVTAICRATICNPFQFRTLIKNDLVFIRVEFLDGDGLRQKGRKWYICEHATDSEIVMTLLKACLTAQEHEIREAFRYDGKRVFDPHHDVNELGQIRLDIREESLV